MVFLPHWPLSPIRGNIKYDLDRVLNILAHFDNPHYKIAPVIHIAGTNGKGSTLAFLESIFTSAGYKTHKYTSPHFLHFNERIVLAGQMIEDSYLYELMERIRYVANEQDLPTLFEAGTIAAFLAFSEIPADVVLLETGMGGRLDATNVIPNPLLTIISSISYDHMEYLGPTLPLIAREKAGIIKNKSIISHQVEEVYQVLFDECEKKRVEYFAFGYDFNVEKNIGKLIYQEKDFEYSFDSPSLVGDHQLINAATAIAAIRQVGDEYNITIKDINSGLVNAKWKGRLEKLEFGLLKKLYPKVEFWLDGAHNTGGARSIRYWLEEYTKNKKLFIIIGLTKGREVKSFISEFFDVADMIYGVQVKSEPSSYRVEELIQEVGFHSKFQAMSSIKNAIDDIVENIKHPDIVILITGSLFLLSDVYKGDID